MTFSNETQRQRENYRNRLFVYNELESEVVYE